jgi:nucleoside-diphosphate-sugar epimerase
MSRKDRTVLILGANGRFGRAAVEAFAAAGWRVLAQARRPLDAPVPPGVGMVQRALTDLDGLAADAAGARIVVYAINPTYTRWEQEAIPLARAGMDLAQRLGARFMLPGNVYNFGESMPELLHEDAAQAPSTRKGEIRRAIEDELASRATFGLRSVVLRAGDFYGAGRGGWLDELVVKSLRRGTLVYPGPFDVPHAWAYLPDLARAFVALAQRTDLPAVARLHFAGHTLTGRELLDVIERVAGEIGATARPLRRRRMGWGLVALVGLVHPLWRELARMSYLWRLPHRLDDAQYRALAGAPPRTPADVALRDSLCALGFGAAATAAAVEA